MLELAIAAGLLALAIGGLWYRALPERVAYGMDVPSDYEDRGGRKRTDSPRPAGLFPLASGALRIQLGSQLFDQDLEVVRRHEPRGRRHRHHLLVEEGGQVWDLWSDPEAFHFEAPGDVRGRLARDLAPEARLVRGAAWRGRLVLILTDRVWIADPAAGAVEPTELLRLDADEVVDAAHHGDRLVVAQAKVLHALSLETGSSHRVEVPTARGRVLSVGFGAADTLVVAAVQRGWRTSRLQALPWPTGGDPEPWASTVRLATVWDRGTFVVPPRVAPSSPGKAWVLFPQDIDGPYSAGLFQVELARLR